MTETGIPYRPQFYFAIALDPIHVGSGEMQMGRVDNVIVRDATNHLPKIPATSLAGAARTYTAMHYPDKYRRPVTNAEGQTAYVSCADQLGITGQRDGACGLRNCPVCVSYGFLQPGGRTLPSMAQFVDAFPVFYPVTSMLGPIWVTAPERLQGLVNAEALVADDLNLHLSPEHGYRLQSGLRRDKLNMGWLLLEVAVNEPPLTEAGQTRLQAAGVPTDVLSRLVLVPDDLFPQIINNNLEVRTSTAINRATGAALHGALFTYEAIPRSTIFAFQIIYKNPTAFLLDGQPLSQDIAWVQEQVEKGLAYMEYLGVGGMNSRGMGRMRILKMGQ